MIKGIIKKAEYFDSVSLMLIAKEINGMPGVIDSGVVMGTQENKSILETSGLFPVEFKSATDTDLLIVIKSDTEKDADNALSQTDELFKKLRNKSGNNIDFMPKSLEGAMKLMPDANLSLISIAGRYAYREAMKALSNNLHVMLFSDNVSIEEELKLKQYAIEKGLLVMGPDCGTAIINGVPLAFANVVNRGSIGIVAASGTGLQEVSSVITNEGAGISQAIGTGGRDVKKEIGGIMFLEAIKALNNDENTKVIVLISKPPHEEVITKIAATIKNITKPVIGILIGGNSEIIKNAGAIPATTLEEAGIIAAAISKGENTENIQNIINIRKQSITTLAEQLSKQCTGRYVRGLFSGGTLCDETQLIFKDIIGYVYSNTPLKDEFKLANAWESVDNTIVDIGDDEFTVGRPHPMIDFSLRKKKLLEESKDKNIAVILMDIVLGYGSNMDPAGELAPVIGQIKANRKDLAIICSITGTDNDPQNKSYVRSELEKAGATVMASNAEASLLTGMIIKNLEK